MEPQPQARWMWQAYVDVVTVGWLALFLTVLLHTDIPVLDALPAAAVHRVQEVLFALTVVFVMDLVLLYRWSDLSPKAFVRAQWLAILMTIPFLRPLGMLRILRAGRLARSFRAIVRVRRAVGLQRNSRRTAKSAAATLRAKKRKDKEREPGGEGGRGDDSH